ncbi:MAG: hypothetical protein Ct9H300mP28_16210 [Pseudomonadota bacterium]|nr:MAG: hypothetical protein Ct9H300mP28_16210 [Pseudomonadota bacterium]
MSGPKTGIAEPIQDKGDEKRETIAVQELYNEKLKKLPESLRKQLSEFENNRQKYLKDNFSFKVREKAQEIENYRTSISGTKIPKIATPKFKDWGEIAGWMGLENFPGSFPYTSGVFLSREKVKIQHACLQEKELRNAPTGDFTCWLKGSLLHA